MAIFITREGITFYIAYTAHDKMLAECNFAIILNLQLADQIFVLHVTEHVDVILYWGDFPKTAISLTIIHVHKTLPMPTCDSFL